MKLLIGLGNPDESHQMDRHNVGHIMIDELGTVEGYLLTKTPTYMNQSGRYVKEKLNQEGLNTNQLVIIHDDWAFEVGDYRLQYGKGHNQHKGVRSVIDSLGTNDFWRIRIGIGCPEDAIDHSEYVLSKLTQDELSNIKKLVVKIKKDLLKISNDEGKIL